MKFPGGKIKALTLSYDDGVVYDRTLIEIMQRYGMKGTFNVNSGSFADTPGGRRLTAAEVKELYDSTGMEVAVHGLYHRRLSDLPDGVMAYEILKDRENLEALTGKLVRGMAYAYGSFSDKTVEVLRNSGIVYGRTTISTGTFDIPKDWLRLPATCHHRAENLMELADKFVNYEKSVADFPWRAKPQLFYLWGHSYEFNDNDNWYIIEKFGEKIARDDGIWHATNIEIYDYIAAYNSLVFSCDCNTVYNPSAKEIFLLGDGVDYTVKPGETLRFK